MGLGEKFQVISFWLAALGTVLVFISIIVGFVGSKLTDKGYWETIKEIKKDVKDASTRKKPDWTPFTKVESNGFPNIGKPMMVKLQFQLTSHDNTIPLMVKIASNDKGSYPNTVTGPAGIVEQLIVEPQTYYVSVSHPSIKWQVSVLGWKDPDL